MTREIYKGNKKKGSYREGMERGKGLSEGENKLRGEQKGCKLGNVKRERKVRHGREEKKDGRREEEKAKEKENVLRGKKSK